MITKHGNVTNANMDDIQSLIEQIRPEDRQEIEDISGHSVEENFQFALRFGEPCLALRTLNDNDLVGILTVCPTGNRCGVIAMSGTVLLEKNEKAFLRGSRDVLKYLDQSYDLLYNVCDARNSTHHKWLKWLGFKFLALKNYGHANVPVYEFARLK